MEWYRVYHGMPHDPKLKVIAHRAKQPMAHVVAVWTCLLDAASQHKTRGTVEVDAEQIAIMQDIETEAVQAIIAAMYTKGMLNEQNRLTAWDKRQYSSTAERVKKHRAKKKETGGNAKKRDVTPGNTPKQDATAGNAKTPKKDTDTDNRLQSSDSEAEVQKKQISDKKSRARAEGEREREKTNLPDDAAEQMLQIWNAEVQNKLTKGQSARLTPKRKQQMAERWRQDFQQDIRAWRYFCEVVGSSDFCLGKVAGKDWTIDLGWAVESSEHVAKILEGGFSGGNHPPKPPACDVPGLQQAWDAVLDAFQRKHGKATCRSWLSNTAVIGLRGNAVVIRCPSAFARQWIGEHYLPDLTRWWHTATEGGAAVSTVELIAEGQP
jgi:hypothetical protein